MMAGGDRHRAMTSIGHLIDSPALAEHLDDADWRIVDCRFDLADTGRGERLFGEGHISGASYAHLDRDLTGPVTRTTGRHPLPEPSRLRDWLQDQGINNRTQVIAYDDTGGTMAVRLWWLLRWLGHTRVAVLDGGLQAWLAAGLALTSEPTPPLIRGSFTGAPDDTQVIDTRTLAGLLDQTNMPLVIDVRTAERFNGEDEPIDPVAGHIPGAVNLPLQDNLDVNGHFKSAAALHQQYAALIGDTPPERVVVMCGSGVTACHSLLAMAVAGYPTAQLYAGSWSEWIRDPARPVATMSGS